MLASHLISTGSICLSIYIYLLQMPCYWYLHLFQTAKYYIVGVLLVTYPTRSHCIKKNHKLFSFADIESNHLYPLRFYHIYIYVLISIIQLCRL